MGAERRRNESQLFTNELGILDAKVVRLGIVYGTHHCIQTFHHLTEYNLALIFYGTPVL